MATSPADCDIGGEVVFDCSKAKRLFGWEPEHPWREAEDAEVTGTRVPVAGTGKRGEAKEGKTRKRESVRPVRRLGIGGFGTSTVGCLRRVHIGADPRTVVVGRGGDIGCLVSIDRFVVAGHAGRRFSLGLLVPVTAFDRERRRSVGVHELVGHGVVRAGPRVLDDAGVVVDREVDQISETRRLGLGTVVDRLGESDRGDPLRELGAVVPVRGTTRSAGVSARSTSRRAYASPLAPASPAKNSTGPPVERRGP